MRHVSLLAFLERMVRDTEFREWYAAQPRQALASHGLEGESLQELYGVLEWGGPYRQTAQIFRPLVDCLVKCWKLGDEDDTVVVQQRLDSMTRHIANLKGRAELSESYLKQARPWWKFWEP